MQLQQSSESLTRRVVRAGAWAVGAHSFDVGISFISNLIMTRLLFPEAFGLIAAASAPIVGLTLVSDFGVHAVIVQSSRGDQAEFLRSAWTFQLVRGAVVWLILVAICLLMMLPNVRGIIPARSAFADPLYPLVTAALGLGLLLGGAESTSVFLNYRQLKLNRIVRLGVVSRLISLVVLIACAVALRNVWALVIGGLANGVSRLILSHTIIPGPRMAFSRESSHIAEIVRFGKWVLVSSIASFVTQQSDVIVFGVIFSTSSLGIYAVAKLMINAAEGLLERLNASLALPLMSEVARTDAASLGRRYYRFRLPIDLIAATSSGFLFVVGPLLVSVLYDTRYSGAGVMLSYLALGLVLYPCQIIRSAFTAIGRPQVVAAVTVVQALSLGGSMLLGYHWFGELGAIVGVSLQRLVPSVIIIALARARGWIRLSIEMRTGLFFVSGLVLGYSALDAWNWMRH